MLPRTTSPRPVHLPRFAGFAVSASLTVWETEMMEDVRVRFLDEIRFSRSGATRHMWSTEMRKSPLFFGAIRLVAGIGLALVASACQEQQRPVPTAPSPSATSNAFAPSTSVNAFAVSGVVYEATPGGLRPLAGVGIDASPDYQSHTPQAASTADGRYEVTTRATSSGIVKVVGERTGYSQPCRVTVSSAANTVQDLYLVSNEMLATAGVPVSMPVVQQVLSGVVFERTPDGDRPVAGAGVTGDFSGGMGWGPSASTVSDAQGRYLLCGISQSELGLSLYVAKPGFHPVYVSVDRRAGGSIDLNRGGTFDVELKRE
jgi:hypothetical protein